jgi:phosphorylcholine metabolism protein LicD
MSFANPKIALENMALARDVLAKHGVSFFLNFGTLLGAIREKGFIPHDHDVDVGILEPGFPGFMAALPELKAQGFVVTTELNEESQMISTFRGGEQLDFFIARPRKTLTGKKWALDGFTRVPARLLDSFKEIDFLGEKFLVPSQAEAFVRRLYGPSWRTPIEGKIARVELGVRFALAFRDPLLTLRSIPTFIRKRLGWASQERRNRAREKT